MHTQQNLKVMDALRSFLFSSMWTRLMDLVVHPSYQTPRPLLSPPRPPSSWVSPKSISKAPELSLLQTPQVVKVCGIWTQNPFILIILDFMFVDHVWCRLTRTFHVVVLSASSGPGCFWPRVLGLHSPVHPAQQPEAHARRHPVRFSGTLRHPPTPWQREPDHLHRRGRISWTGERHPMDQWGKTQK